VTTRNGNRESVNVKDKKLKLNCTLCHSRSCNSHSHFTICSELLVYKVKVMQRLPAVRLGARLMPRSHGISTQQLSRRWLSDSQVPRSASSRPGVLVWGIGAAVAAGGGYLLLNGGTASKTKGVPLLNPVSSEDDISVISPVPVLDLKAANQKLREQAQSFVFDGKDGQKGRVDVVRVASNDPVEDEWSVAIGKGIHGGTALYAGVYDGHSYVNSPL
jgi:pyruvate dehydrogenase phosphatase